MATTPFTIDHLSFATSRPARREVLRRLNKLAIRRAEIDLHIEHDATRTCCRLQSEEELGYQLGTVLTGRGVELVIQKAVS